MSNRAYGFVYVWYDRKRKKYCVGSHHGLEDDGYTSSTGWFDDAYRKRSEDFKRRIVARNYFKDCFRETQALEQRWLDMIKLEELGSRYYNIKPFATGGSYAKGQAKASTRKKLADAKIGIPLSNDVKAKISNTLKGRKCTPAELINRSKAHTGRPCSAAHRESISKTLTGRPCSESKKAKLSKHYKFMDSNGVIHDVHGLTQFCDIHNLSKGHMCQVALGRRKSHKGWTAISVSASTP